MRLSIKTEIHYAFAAPTDVLLQIEAAIIPEQHVERANIVLPETEHFARLPGHDTIGDRIWLRVEGDVHIAYESTVEVQRIGGDLGMLEMVPPHLLPAETIEYLMPSRYCPTDEFHSLVDADFGDLRGGARIMAIRDWVENALTYSPGSSNASTDAMATYIKRAGVCRDYAHLVVTMARASMIPARFASVYAPGVEPQDFHAVAEVFLDDTWHVVDATGMASAHDIAKIGVGRDAADVSFLTSFGATECLGQSVSVTAE